MGNKQISHLNIAQCFTAYLKEEVIFMKIVILNNSKDNNLL